MREWFGKQLGSQLSQPHGFWGAVVAKLMNFTNRRTYHNVYDLLELSKDDRVLEIGFGNGAFIKDIVQKIQPGKYMGIDISETMMRLARHRNFSLIKSGKALIMKAKADNLPFDDNLFNKVFTANTIYFWEGPALVMNEVKRVLLPGGKFVVALSTKAAMEDSIYVKEKFKLYDKKGVEELFTNAAFINVNSTYNKSKTEDIICVSGQKATTTNSKSNNRHG